MPKKILLSTFLFDRFQRKINDVVDLVLMNLLFFSKNLALTRKKIKLSTKQVHFAGTASMHCRVRLKVFRNLAAFSQNY